eukprot:scaffold3515_cov126-Cylindrotheca_fusiformis.AAC.35
MSLFPSLNGDVEQSLALARKHRNQMARLNFRRSRLQRLGALDNNGIQTGAAGPQIKNSSATEHGLTFLEDKTAILVGQTMNVGGTYNEHMPSVDPFCGRGAAESGSKKQYQTRRRSVLVVLVLDRPARTTKSIVLQCSEISIL